MAKAIKKRQVKTHKKVAPAPVRGEPELAFDAKPIVFPCSESTVAEPIYKMICKEGEYHSPSWIGLGWAIFTHRLWHLWKDGSFKD